MKKYLMILKSEFMTNISYITNVLAGFVGYFLILYIFLNLWEYMYSDPNELINGYNMNQMIWYVIITEILWSVTSGRKLCNTIIQDVKGGNIAYNINKPYSYIGYSLCTHLGGALLRIIIFIILGILTGLLFMHEFPSINILEFLIILVSMILAVVISSLLIIFIGLLSFIIEDSSPFYWVYSKIILVIGTIFPIEYFPAGLQVIMKYSPIYVTSYGPAKLFVDFSWNTTLSIFIAQIAYIIIAYFLCHLMYKKGVRKLNVNGG